MKRRYEVPWCAKLGIIRNGDTKLSARGGGHGGN